MICRRDLAESSLSFAPVSNRDLLLDSWSLANQGPPQDHQIKRLWQFLSETMMRVVAVNWIPRASHVQADSVFEQAVNRAYRLSLYRSKGSGRTGTPVGYAF